jgi:hypothetical protein
MSTQASITICDNCKRLHHGNGMWCDECRAESQRCRCESCERQRTKEATP